MKRIIITLIIAFTSFLVQAQNYNPFVAQGIISPSPLNRLEISGTGQVSFLVGNSGDDVLPLVAGQEMLLEVSLSRGIPNNANPLLAVGGTFATYFNWQYNATTKTYLGTQSTAIPAALNGGVGDITIAYKVTSNSIKVNPQNGFNVTLTPPAYSNGINTLSDDQVSSYTWTEEQFNTDPDIAAALLNVPVTGNVSTNDDVPVGTTYGTPVANPSNPSACAPVMNATGSYTFVCSTPGVYEYQVPVCAPGQTSNCPTELLKITVTDPGVVTAGPTVNPDVMNTLQNTPTTLNVLSNDACNNGPSCTLSNPNITDQPNNGTVVVNPNGTLTYTPNSTFVGTDTIMYSTCDNQSPSKCDTTQIIVTVLPTGAANTTSANEDFITANGNAPVTGNVLTNDTDPEGNTQTVAPQNVTNAKGTFVLNANGTFTFTAAVGYSGPVEYTYTVCDNGTPSACDTATLHILVTPLPFNTDPDIAAALLNVPVTGNVSTNDDVPVGTTYGTPVANPSNPSACAPVMSATGSYTFVCSTPGVYEYQVPVCAPGQTSNCPTELLKITVKDPGVVTAGPTVNPDVMNTLQNTPTTLNVLSNDACNNGPSCTLSNPNITDQPNNGTVVVNADGTLTYTPDSNFVGTDTIMYSTCDNQSPSKCDTTQIIVTVNPTGAANTTSANEDFITANGNAPVTGNVLTNDTDPEGNTQTVAPQNVTNAKGTFVLNANGTFTFTAAVGYSGPVEYTYTVCDNGTPSACDTATLHILVTPLPFNTDPDIAAALLNVPVTGNVSTNDDVPVGTTYGTPVANPSNPSACAPVMSATGSYTFVCSTPGVYEYQVPVCAPGQTSNCPTELLKITVTDPGVVTAGPTVNPDVMNTLQNTPTTLNVLSNDACNNGPSCTLSNPNITDQPNNGTVVVNANGTLTYTPNSTFVGTDTIMYSTCDNQSPSKCDTTQIIVTVLPTGAANTTSANEDFITANGNAPVTGNVLTNDTDPEGNTQTVAPQNVTNAKGTFVLNANGTFTFTAAVGYSGPVEYTYTVCDNGTPSACDTATLHILVTPLPFNTDPDIAAALLNVPVTGNVSTNDDVPVGTTYGTPVANPSNPSACAPVMSATGSYTFVCSTPGVYEYQVPVCAPGQTSNCPTELLKITVTDPGVVTAGPTVNPDVMNTLQNTPTTLNVLSNDACNNGPSCTLSNPNITDQPNNGTVVVNANGTLTYTPNSTFVGTDTIMYSTCDNQSPSKCDTTQIIVTVLPTGAANTTSANEDFITANGNAPVTGNVLTNDTDPEGNTQTVAPQNVTNAKGTFVLNANGTFTFTAAVGYSGPVEYTYTVCDNGTPSACDTATLHILVLPPDVTPNITITPNVMHGISSFNVTVKVTELNGVNTNGTITVRIPKDSRVTFTYNSALTTVGFTAVNNSAWTYNGSNPFFHIFTTTNVILAKGFSTFGFVASFNPLNTDGKYTMTSTISSGSGSEIKTTNNNDSESADYFHN